MTKPEDITEVNVTEIPFPWAHPWGTVVGIEHPEDRPRVVDLVFSDGLKTAETKTAMYALGADGIWDSARLVRRAAAKHRGRAARG